MAGTGKSVLMVKFISMEEKSENKSQAIIEIIDSGPIKITGNILLKDMKRDKEDVSTEIWLCRCGKSENKPYCDESHRKK